MSHDCFKQFDEALAAHNGRLAFALQVTEKLGLQTRLLIGTEKIDVKKRKSVPHVVASFCPFCGVSLDGETKSEAAITKAGEQP